MGIEYDRCKKKAKVRRSFLGLKLMDVDAFEDEAQSALDWFFFVKYR